MKLIGSILLSAMSLLLLSSCIKERYNGPEIGMPTRVVLFYLAGDNNLGPISSVPELLRQGWTYTGNRCLIYCDLPNSKPQLLSLRGGCSTNPTPYIELVAEYEEENSVSAEVFSRVVNDVVAMYPADSYGLVFSSHATGWLPLGALSNPSARTIGQDTDQGFMGSGVSEMELTDFAAAIDDHQFDFVIFETCLMSGVEVAYELRNKTSYILASSAEMFAAGYTPIYQKSAKHLFNTAISVEESLKRFASDYFNYINKQSGVQRSATQSIIKTSKLDDLASLMKETDVMASYSLISDIWSVQRFDRPGMYGDLPVAPRYLDLKQSIDNIMEPYYSKIADVIDEVVVWKAATPWFTQGERGGFEIKCHSGLTTYIPQSQFEKLNQDYKETSWYKTINRYN